VDRLSDHIQKQLGKEFGVKDKPTPVSRAVILDDSQRLLLGYRKDTERWEMPGGKIEVLEPAEEAARRELSEETSLSVYGRGEFLGYTDAIHLSGKRSSITLYFLYWDWQGTPTVCESSHTKWQFFSLNELPPNIMQACSRAIPHVRDFLSRNEWPVLPSIHSDTAVS
jgi:8-oxo-dGTP diphosphatase